MDWSKVSEFKMGDKEVVKVYDNVHNKILWQKVAVQWLTLTANNDDNSISLASVADSDVEYAVDGGEWTSYDTATTLTGSKVEIRALNKTVSPISLSGSNVTGKFKVSGYLDSILDWKKLRDKKQSEITHAASCFASMFDQNTNLTDCSGLVLPDIETLPDKCYMFMFRRCSNCTKAFTSITAKNFGVSSCNGMFYAAGVTTGFALDNAETCTTSSFESMFDNCPISSISATTFAKLKENTADMTGAMRYMLRGTNITTPMTTLPIKAVGTAMYLCMFTGCNNLTTTPTIMATGHNHSNVNAWAEGCMAGMFHGCENLTTAQDEIYMTEAAGADFKDMFNGCYRLTKGTKFTKLTKVRTGGGNVFNQTYNNCKALTSNYDLPTTLTIGGTVTQLFYSMFSDCTSLVTPPDIPTITQNSDATSTTTDNMFRNMFSGCEKMTSLPAFNDKVKTGLQNNDCQMMFNGCKAITSIPANYMSSYTSCGTGTFNSMFASCTALTTIGADMMGTINVPSGKYSCFSYMFSKCTALTTLPTTWLKVTGNCGSNLFDNMFNGCAALVTFQGLDISTLTTAEDMAFKSMFNSCTKLTDVDLSVGQFTELGSQCCSTMFYGCTSLYYMPQLWFENVTKVGNNCFSSMFSGCSVLSEPLVIKATTIGTTAFSEMYTNTNIYMSETEDEEYATPWYCYQGGYAVFNNTKGTFTGNPETGKTYYLRQQAILLKSDAKTNFTFKTASTANLQTSTDNNTWTDYTTSSEVTAVDGKLYIRGKNNTAAIATSTTQNFQITSDTNDVRVNGYLPSLVRYNKQTPTVYIYQYQFIFINQTALISSKKLRTNDSSSNYMYRSLFNGCINMVNAMESLPATAVKMYMYTGTFYNCKALKTVPTMSITSIASYGLQQMFYGCRKLEDASNISIITNYVNQYSLQSVFDGCIYLDKLPTIQITGTVAQSGLLGMFTGCESMIDASAVSIDANLYDNACQTMFSNCYRLKKPATFGNDCKLVAIKSSGAGYNCYGMYLNCYNLQEMPDLPMPSLTNCCYLSMFTYCYSLRTAKKIQATGNIPYAAMQSMFSYCYNLESVPTDMLSGLTSCTGSGVCKNMFINCYLLHNAPTISQITTLQSECFANMFCDCIELTTPPVLPTIAGDLPSKCYQNMFQRSGVQMSATSQGEYTNAWVISGTAASDSLSTMFDGTNGQFTGTPVSQTYYYQKTYALKLYGSSNFGFQYNGDATLEYSTDNLTYTTYTKNTLLTQKKLYLRGKGNTVVGYSNGTTTKFLITSSTVTVQGDLMSLLDYDTPYSTEMGERAFYCLFNAQSYVTYVTKLICSANTVTAYGMDNLLSRTGVMFTAPGLVHATTCAEYSYRSLYLMCPITTPGNIPLQTRVMNGRQAYTYMFYECTKLTTIQRWILGQLEECNTQYVQETQTDGSVKNVLYGNHMDYMFAYCPVLSSVPDGLIPDAKLTYLSCKEMFTAPTDSTSAYYPTAELNIGAVCRLFTNKNDDGTTTYQSIFSRMFAYHPTLKTVDSDFCLRTKPSKSIFEYAFRGCTALTNVPDLPYSGTIVSYAYDNMFRDCTSITEVPENWLPSDKVNEYGYHSLLYNTRITKAPKLPAHTLGTGAYAWMFAACTALKELPEMNAEYTFSGTEGSQFNSMFCNSGVKISETQTGDYTNAFKITWSGTTATTTGTDTFKGTSGTYTGNLVSGTTYYYSVA